MDQVVLAPETVTAVARELSENLRERGLVIVHKSVAQYGFFFMQRREQLLKQKAVTPSLIVKYQLLNQVQSIGTIKNMVKDGRITKNEWFKDNKNVLHITTAAINRLNND